MDIDPDNTQRDAGAIEESEDSDGMYGLPSKAKSKKRPRKKAAAAQHEEEIPGNTRTIQRISSNSAARFKS
jgi:hypothetical protein